jgi:hypothetical protein
MIKVYATEALALAGEEGVQMLGGYGYCSDYVLERLYRDERINRIFEGTNEINRMIIPGMIMRKAMKGELPFLQAAQKVAGELLEMPSFDDVGEPKFLEDEGKMVVNMKDHQEVLADAADIITEAYACESALLRTLKKVETDGEEAAAVMADMLTLAIHDSMEGVGIKARQLLANTLEGDELRTMSAGLRRLVKHDPVSREKLHGRIAEAVIAAEGYPFK